VKGRDPRMAALIAGGITVFGLGCGKKEAKPAAPAKVEGAVKETELATITLTPEAEKRLGIETATLERKVVAHVRVVGGEVVAPPGRSLAVTAPLPGVVLPPPSGRVLGAGERVQQGQDLFRLAPLPPADLELQRDRAREELAAARARLDQARDAAERTRKLRQIGAGSAKAEEEAKAQAVQAEAAVRSAQSRLQFLSATDLNDSARAASAIRVQAPRSGVLMEVLVGPGSSVVAGAPLAQVVSDDMLWVRVPVYSGDVSSVNRGAAVSVTRLGEAGRSWTAAFVTAPPRADAATATADLTYALPPGTGGLRPGERVMVSLPLVTSEEALVVPWPSILYDIDGGTWVYAVPGPHVYSRRRVELQHVSGDMAVLRRGPSPGTVVVKTGAAELFGTEFGAK
jgi:membrane fusion protein, heavy metal efflux system